MPEPTMNIPFYKTGAKADENRWFVTDFTKEQIETHIAALESRLAAADAELTAMRKAAPGSVLSQVWEDLEKRAVAAEAALSDLQAKYDHVSKLWNEARMKLPSETASWRAVIAEKEAALSEARALLTSIIQLDHMRERHLPKGEVENGCLWCQWLRTADVVLSRSATETTEAQT